MKGILFNYIYTHSILIKGIRSCKNGLWKNIKCCQYLWLSWMT